MPVYDDLFFLLSQISQRGSIYCMAFPDFIRPAVNIGAIVFFTFACAQPDMLTVKANAVL